MPDKEELKKKARERIIQLMGGWESQQDFADYCDISKFSLSQYVNGTNAPGNVNAAKIAKAFRLNPLWVMGFDEPMRSEEDEARYQKYMAGAKAINERFKHREALGITNEEWELISAYRYLNEEGRKKALSNVADLTYIEKYRKDKDDIGYIRF